MKLNRRTNWRNKMNALEAAQQFLQSTDLGKPVLLKICSPEGVKLYKPCDGIATYNAGAILTASVEVWFCERCYKLTDKFERINKYCPCCFEKGKRVVRKEDGQSGTIHNEFVKGMENISIVFDGEKKKLYKINDIYPICFDWEK